MGRRIPSTFSRDASGRRAGYDEPFVREVARVMEYHLAYDLYRHDIEAAPAP